MSQGSSNPTTDLKKVAGTAVDVNTGNASAGTQRVVIANDQPSITVDGVFWQSTQPVSGTVSLSSGSLSALETTNAVQSGTWNINTVSTVTDVTNAVKVTDNGGSLTVDAPVATPVSVRFSNGTTFVDTIPVSQSGGWDIGTITSITNDVNIADGGNSITVDDGGVSLTVDGTVSLSTTTLDALETTNAVQSGAWSVSATQSGTWNVGTVTSITNTVSIDDNGSSITIDAPVASPAYVRLSDGTNPVSVATSDNQTTIIGHVDGIESLLTTIDADTSTLAGAVASGQMQVDVVAALPAGNNNIGNVDIVSVPAPLNITGAGAASTALRVQLADESLSALENISVTIPGTVDLGTVSLTALETISVTQSGTWDIRNVSGTVSLPTGASTSAKQDTIIGHVDGIETVLGTIDADTGNIVTAVQLLDNAVVTNGTTNTTSAFQVAGYDGSVARRISTNTSGHINIADGGGSITVDGTVTANLSATDNAVLDAIAADTALMVTDLDAVRVAVETIDNAISGSEMQVDVITLPSLPSGNNNIGNVDVVTLPSLPAGSNVIGGVTQSGSWTVTPSTTDTHDGAAGTTGNMLVGYASSTAPAAVSANGDAARLWVTTSGALNIADGGATISIDDGGGAITIDGTVTANLSATDNAVLDNIATAVQLIDNAISGNEMQVDVVTLPSLPTGTNSIGNIGSITNVVSVNDNGGSLTVDGSVNAVQSGAWDIATLTSLTQFNGNAINLGAGTTSSGTLRTVEASSSTGAQSNPSLSTTSATLLAANTARRGATIYNASTSIVYVRLSSSAASATTFTTRLYPDDYYEVPANYNGAITAILNTGTTTSVQVTQIT